MCEESVYIKNKEKYSWTQKYFNTKYIHLNWIKKEHIYMLYDEIKRRYKKSCVIRVYKIK